MQDFVEEGDRPLEGVDAVFQLADRMSLVGEHEQLAADSLLREHSMDLLRLLERHTRIVRAVLDEERCADPVDMRDR